MFTEEKSLDDVLAVSLPAARCTVRSSLHATCWCCVHELLRFAKQGHRMRAEGQQPSHAVG